MSDVSPVVEPAVAAAPAADAPEVSPVDVLAAEAEVADTGLYLEVRGRKFKLVEIIPAMTMLKLSAASDPKTPIPAQMSAIAGFLHKIVVPDERDEFIAFLEDADDPVIEFDELNTILTEATEIIGGGRPTTP